MEVLSKRLAQQRILANKTQGDVASVLNVNRATYSQYELGKNLPPIDKLVVIADLFGVSIDYLVGREISPHTIKQQLLAAQEMCCAAEKIIGDVLSEN